MKKVLFISSTGGHLNELMQLSSMFNRYDYNIITEKDKSTVCLKNKYNNRIHYLIYGTKDHLFTYFFKFIYNFVLSFIYFIKIKPNVIITTGTHTAVPICYIGKIFGSKIVYIETFANRTTKTLSGKLVYPIANLFVVQWEEMKKLYPRAVYGGWIY
jgi:beta-1,4-N-acetylglucosaminyltransferase